MKRNIIIISIGLIIAIGIWFLIGYIVNKDDSIIFAADVASGEFGYSTGEGNYSFPANVGIGINNDTPEYTLDVKGDARFTQPIIVGTPIQDNQAATKSYVDTMCQ